MGARWARLPKLTSCIHNWKWQMQKFNSYMNKYKGKTRIWALFKRKLKVGVKFYNKIRHWSRRLINCIKIYNCTAANLKIKMICWYNMTTKLRICINSWCKWALPCSSSKRLRQAKETFNSLKGSIFSLSNYKEKKKVS